MNNFDYNFYYNFNLPSQDSMDTSHLPYPLGGHETSANTNEVDNNNQFSSQQVNSPQSNFQPLNSQWWPTSQQFLQDPRLQGLPTTMGFQHQGNIPQGPNDSFQGMHSQPLQSQPFYPGYYPSSSPPIESTDANAREQRRLLPAQRRDLHCIGTQGASQLQSHGLHLHSGNPNQLYSHQPVQPVLPQALSQPYTGTQQHSWPVELNAPQSGGANQLGLQQPVQPAQPSPQTQPYYQPQQYGRLAEQATQPSAVRTCNSSENPICVENDGAENPVVPQPTAVDCEPISTTAPAVATAPARIHALHMYYEVTALIQAQKWDAAPLHILRKTLNKAVQYWPGVYDCKQKRWFLHKERPESFFCKDRWGIGAMTWGWNIDDRIRVLEKSVAEERESLLVAPINGAAPVNNKQRKRSSTSDADASSEPAAKRAKKTGQSSAGRPFSEPTPATAAPKKNARRNSSAQVAPVRAAPKNASRKSSAQVAPKRADRKASTQAATPQAGPRASGENKTRNQPKAPMARRNEKSGTEIEADLAPASAETPAEPSGKVETSAASPAPVAETAASQASIKPSGKECGVVEIATADSVPAEENDCWTDALFEEKPEPLQEQTGVPAEKEAAVEEALPVKDVKPEDVEPKAVEPDVVKPEAVEPEAAEPEAVKPEAVEPEDAESEDQAFTAEMEFHLADAYKEQDLYEVAEDVEEPYHEPELSHGPTNEVCLAFDVEDSSHEPANDVYLAVDEESEESEEE